MADQLPVRRATGDDVDDVRRMWLSAVAKTDFDSYRRSVPPSAAVRAALERREAYVAVSDAGRVVGLVALRDDHEVTLALLDGDLQGKELLRAWLSLMLGVGEALAARGVTEIWWVQPAVNRFLLASDAYWFVRREEFGRDEDGNVSYWMTRADVPASVARIRGLLRRL